MNIFRNADFIFNTPFDFKERFNGEEGFFSETGKVYKFTEGYQGTIFETNVIYDLPNYPLWSWEERGAGARVAWFEMAGNTMGSHVAEFPVGTYKKAHRHAGGSHVIIIKGKGYSLMWREGSPIQRFDWQEGSMIVPPERWFHQHFNTGPSPARYLAIHGLSTRKFNIGKKRYAIDKSMKEGGDQIDYEDELPEIREMFEKELAKSGIAPEMPRFTKKG